jgi:CxxC motif-containing protein (DUF1111 family)
MILSFRSLRFPAVALTALVGAAFGVVAGQPTDLPQAAFEPAEARPGGAATSDKAADRNAFSHSSANMPFERELDFKIGNGFFKRIWVSAPSSTRAADGLGPIYNAKSCQRCHLKDGRGHPPAGNYPDDTAVSMFLRLSIPPQTAEQRRLIADGRQNVIPEPTYGGQLQDFSVAGVAAEGRMHIAYDERDVTLADGTVVHLRAPRYSITDLAYGPLHPETMISPRVAPSMIGLGLLERVPEADIRAAADPQDADGDGVSGRPNEVWSHVEKTPRLGRFGWKAGAPSIDEQSQSAFNGDLGIATPLFPDPYGDCTEAQAECRAAPSGADPRYDDLEAHGAIVDLVTFYSRNLAVPARRDPQAPKVLAGKKLFADAGCAACHTPSHVTAEAPDQPWLGGQRIWPYTDLLLHDMGDGLADGRPEGRADGREWRTAPLWGVGLTETVNGHTNFLHDGRARNLLEAILWHGGEAAAARDRVVSMSREERDALLAFLRSL